MACSTLLCAVAVNARLLASRKDAPPINPTQLVNAHVCSSRVLAVSPIAGLLILPSSPVCELDALRVACMRERSFLPGWIMDACCWMDVCPARKHSYPSPWPGRPERHVARSFSRPCTRVDRLEQMSISVAISRWADVRVTMLRGRALPWASSRISSLFSCTPAQSRAASNPFVGSACMNGSRREGRGEKNNRDDHRARSI